MPRPKYQITPDDFNHATFYLSARMRGLSLEFSDDVSHTKVDREYQAAKNDSGRKRRAELLNAWCEKYLNTDQWDQLKAGIRKRRERWERGGQQLKSVTVSRKAHKLLVELAERDEVTQSEVLEHYLRQALNRRPRKTTSRRRAR